MEFSEEQVMLHGFRCVTLRSATEQKSQPCDLELTGKTFLIEQSDVFVYQRCYAGKTIRYQTLGIPYPLHWIYPMIHILYDKNGREIARRTGRGQPLLQNPRVKLIRRCSSNGRKHSRYKINAEQSQAG